MVSRSPLRSTSEVEVAEAVASAPAEAPEAAPAPPFVSEFWPLPSSAEVVEVAVAAVADAGRFSSFKKARSLKDEAALSSTESDCALRSTSL